MKIELEKYKEAVANRFKNMTAEQKLKLSLKLYFDARELKKATLKQLHPELTEEEIEKRVKEIFFYAKS